MEGLQEVTNALLNGTIRDPLRPPLPLDQGSQPQPKIPIAIMSGTAKATHFKFSMHIHRVDMNKGASKQFGKSIQYPQAQSGSLKNFQGTHI